MPANIHIEGSSAMSRREFLAALPAYREQLVQEERKWEIISFDVVRNNRTTRSLLREWAAHKLCYALHIKRSSTESVDLDWPQAWYFRLGYFVIGGLALIFY
jgi:hypothetical protein